MRKTSWVAFVGLVGLLTYTQFTSGLAEQEKLDPAKLIGTWLVDLRQKPTDPPYLKEFQVTATADGTLSGTFYESEIKDGRTNKDWSLVHFAFTTTDGGGGTYNTSGRLVGDKLEGSTHSLGRNFLIVWTGTRKPASK